MAMSGATGTTADVVGLPLAFLAVLLASGIWGLTGAPGWPPDSRRAATSTCASPWPTCWCSSCEHTTFRVIADEGATRVGAVSPGR